MKKEQRVAFFNTNVNFRRPVCSQCEVELRPHKNGVEVVDHAEWGPIAVFEADEWQCPNCHYKGQVYPHVTYLCYNEVGLVSNSYLAQFGIVWMLIAFAGFSLAQGTLIWSIVGACAAIAAAALSTYFVYQDRQKKKAQRRYEEWLVDPLEVTYLIPKVNYKAKCFPGAPETEQYPTSLKVQLGKTYRIMHVIIPKLDLTILDVEITFSNSDSSPIHDGSDNPYIIQETVRKGGRLQVQNWHGGWFNPDNIGARPYIKGKPWYIGNRFKCSSLYQGEMILRFTILERDPRVLEKRLPFEVVDGSDDIPFMEVKANDEQGTERTTPTDQESL